MTACALFIGLTRTQIGRDALRDEITARFNRSFKGQLTIGRLTGNLVNDLFASDVRLLDEHGEVVARVDSLILRPDWRDLFRRTISARSITLVRPEFRLVRDAEGRWNFREALTPLHPRAPGGPADPWRLLSLDVRVVDGVVLTRNEGALPSAVARRQIFDWTNARLLDLDTKLSLDWRGDRGEIALDALSGHLPEVAVSLISAQGRLRSDGARVWLDRIAVETDQSRLLLTAAGPMPHGPLARALDSADVELRLHPSRLDARELRRLFPILPLDAKVAASLHAEGRLSDLRVERFSLASGETSLEGRARLRGMPDSVRFEVSIAEARANFPDLAALLPGASIPELGHVGPVAGRISATGLLVPAASDGPLRLRSEARIALDSRAGSVSGVVRLAHETGRPLRYDLQLQAGAIDPGMIRRDPALAGRLDGTLRLDGRGTDPATRQAALTLALRPSEIGGRSLDTLALRLRAAGRRLAGTGFIRQGSGSAFFTAAAELEGASPAYRLAADVRALDLGRIVRDAGMDTRLNGRIELDARGTRASALHGTLTVRVDSSFVRMGEREASVAPNRLRLVVAPPESDGPRVVLESDVADAEIRGAFNLQTVVATSELWVDALRRTVAHEQSKRLRATVPAGGLAADSSGSGLIAFVVSAESLRVESRRARVRRALLAADSSGRVEVDASVRLKRTELLGAFYPLAPAIHAAGTARIRYVASADTLVIESALDVDSLSGPSVRADAFTVTFRTTSGFGHTLERVSTAELEASVPFFQASRTRLEEVRLSAYYQRMGGQLFAQSARAGQASSLRLAAVLDLLEDRNRLTLVDLSLRTSGLEWSNPSEEIIDFYADAVVLDDLLLEHRPQASPMVPRPPQRIRIGGALTDAATDSISFAVESLQLSEISRIAALKRPLAGVVDGRFVLTGALRQPSLTGGLQVSGLAFNGNPIGQLVATSRFRAGDEEVALDVRLRPEEDPVPGTKPYRSNVLRVHGGVRLPGFTALGALADPGALDLRADVSRLDLFFLEEIFPGDLANVVGHAAGQGAITGDFRKPVFSGAFDVPDGRFDVPKFDLHFTARGPVTVDRRGLRTQNALLTDDTGGSAVLNGGLLFNDYRYFSFDVSARLDELQIIDVPSSRDLPFYGRIWASGDATLQGPVSNAILRSSNAVTTPKSEIYIPITPETVSRDETFIVFTDSTGRIPDLKRFSRRENVLATRPRGERTFVDGLGMSLNIQAPKGSTVRLVIDPLLGDVINAVGSGRIQLELAGGEFNTYGTFTADAGDYLFTASEVFARRFYIEPGGTITWDGDPVDARLRLLATYHTRASLAGLETFSGAAASQSQRIPLVISMDLTGRLSAPEVKLSMEVERDQRTPSSAYSTVEELFARLDPDRAALYATSVLLTNSFLLSEAAEDTQLLGESASGLAFNSISQLVGSVLNRFVNQVASNVDLNVGFQGNELSDLDFTYGVALHLLDERLVIRGQGVVEGPERRVETPATDALQSEFAVEYRLSPGVSVEVFWRRENELGGSTISNDAQAYGAGLSYQTEFSSWRRLWRRLTGRATPEDRPVRADTVLAAERP